MEVILTKQLLGALIKDGYRYFLCKTSSASNGCPDIKMTLKPVKMHPLLHLLPAPYQRYYKVSQELLQMAEGLPGVQVLIELKGVRSGTETTVHGLLKVDADSL